MVLLLELKGCSGWVLLTGGLQDKKTILLLMGCLPLNTENN